MTQSKPQGSQLDRRRFLCQTGVTYERHSPAAGDLDRLRRAAHLSLHIVLRTAALADPGAAG